MENQWSLQCDFIWWFLHNAFSAIFFATIENVLHLMDWWSVISFVQPAHAFDPKPIFQTECAAVVSWWLTTQEMCYLCQTAVLSYKIWCVQPDGKISSVAEANACVSLDWIKLVVAELQFFTQGGYLLGSEFFTVYLEFPFDLGDHWLLRVHLTISGASI